MKRRVFFTGLMGLISGVLLNAQVTIVSMIEPGEGALLELKEHTPQGNNSTATKGLLFPRVALKSYDNLFPMFESTTGSGAGTYYVKGSQQYLKSSEDSTHIGLVVYNTDVTTFTEGLHFWDGTSWLLLSGNLPVKPSIETLLCESKYISLNRLAVGTYYDQILKIPYTGGNGGAYSATSPQTYPNGLSIERLAGTLANGQGEVAYRIFGTPTSLLPNNLAEFSIDFLGKTCTVTIGDDVEIKNMQFMRKVVPLNAQTTENSEIEFGNLKVRFKYTSSTLNENNSIPEISTTLSININATIWYQKTGTEGSPVPNGEIGRNLYNLGVQTVLNHNTWTNLAGNYSGVSYKSYNLNPANRDTGEAIVVFQHNDIKDVYRLTFNVYGSISADQTAGTAAVDGSCTIFIEKLD